MNKLLDLLTACIFFVAGGFLYASLYGVSASVVNKQDSADGSIPAARGSNANNVQLADIEALAYGQNRSAEEGLFLLRLALLRVSDFNGYSSFMSQLLAKDTRKFAVIFTESNGQFSDLRLWMKSLAEPARKDLLKLILLQANRESPQLITDFTKFFDISDIDSESAISVARSLLHLGGKELQWMNSASEEYRHEILEAAIVKESFSERRLTEAFARNWLKAATELSQIFDYSKVELAVSVSGGIDSDISAKIDSIIDLSDRQKLQQAITSQFVNTASAAQISEKLQLLSPDQRIEFLSAAAPILLITNHSYLTQLLQASNNPNDKQTIENAMIQHGGFDILLSRRAELLNNRLAASTDMMKFEPVISGFLQSSVEIDPRVGAAVLSRLPDGKEKEKLTSEFTQAWGSMDPVALSGWIEELKPGKIRDIALRELVDTSGDEPGSAIPNAASISSLEVRQQAMFKILDRWKTLDRNLAANLLRGVNLPADELSLYVGRLEGK